MKYYNYDVIFQEIPDETTLAINISNCPNRCLGCHSPFLWDDTGTELTIQEYDRILSSLATDITCVCFMGGDANPAYINYLATYTYEKYPFLKIGWYTGKKEISEDINLKCFDYIKVGQYIKRLGGLRSTTTNQRMYKVLHPTTDTTKLKDITEKYWKNT